MLERIRAAITAFRSPHFSETLGRIESRISGQEALLERRLTSLGNEFESQRKKLDTVVINLREELNNQSLYEKFDQLATNVQHWREQLSQLQITSQRIEKLTSVSGREQRRKPLSASAYEAISRRGVFVVGAARSGTTILHTCFNLSPDVCMLGEANFWEIPIQCRLTNQSTYDFVSIFNERQAAYRNSRFKGLYLPQGPFPDRDLFDTLHRLGQQFRYVGDKIALGAAIKKIGDDWEPEFLEFQARYFFASHYFFIIRRPDEAIWSMIKLFRDIRRESLIACWLRSVRVSLEMYQLFPNAFVVFQEDLCKETTTRFAEILGIDLPVSENLLKPSAQMSTLRDGELPESLLPYRDDLNEFRRLYTEIRARFCPHSLKNHGEVMDRPFFRSMRQSLTEAIEKHEAPRGSTSATAA